MIKLNVNDRELIFEHSLVSLSAWEAEYEKPFYPPDDEKKTRDEMLRYFELMLVGESSQYEHLIILLTADQIQTLASYIGAKHTATTIRETAGKSGSRENITSELIYYWLVQFRIPFKPTDEWHLNNLLMLVKVCGVKNAPEKKTRTSIRDRAAAMRLENERRRKMSGSSG